MLWLSSFIPVSAPINPGVQSNGSVEEDEQSRVTFPIDDGITIQLCVIQGRIICYIALRMPASEAFYDWRIESGVGCNTAYLDTDEIRMMGAENDTLFVTIEGGDEGENEYSLNTDVSGPG